ncbi:DNA-directed RNA polymerases I and III subunit RPAC2 [Exaiptasia diaphana]|uniref:DNA-directed RNA polymerases I and III subunit RPAC2 n=1 Tax=Exaiptasia diaphana TaxID=2652724 RepID=A0A913XYG6_EXADI|nr:DNA-directed RNA polymerases I and III subunit RPAC2 [Exaiptasia diaphana]KXJ23972.1 DNA-directed RNA polymerases I and III subunit RPAC2 [Exaiptasia diaphana]
MADEDEPEKHKLEVIPTGDPDDETCATFVMHGEDHTLGNSLRYMIMKNPEVKFCGYSLPHPSENKINLRIQTYGSPATDVLRRGLSELSTLCEHALATFEASVNDYKEMKTKRRHSGSFSSSDES